MRNAVLTLSDGQVYDVKIPDGLTKEQVQAQIRQKIPPDVSIESFQEAMPSAGEAVFPSLTQGLESEGDMFSDEFQPMESGETIRRGFKDLATLPARSALGLFRGGATMVKGGSPEQAGFNFMRTMRGDRDVASPMVTDIADDPTLVPTTMLSGGLATIPRVAQMAQAGRGGKALVGIGRGAIEGLSGGIVRPMIEGEDIDAGAVAQETGFGAAGGLLGEFMDALPAVTGKTMKTLGSQSGVPAETIEYALSKKGKRFFDKVEGQDIRDLQFELAKDLNRKLNNLEEVGFQEGIVQDALQNMPPIDEQRILDALDDSLIKPKGNRPLQAWEKEANQKVSELYDTLIPDTGQLDAVGALDLRRSIDSNVKFDADPTGNVGKAVNKANKNARTALMQGLKESAQQSGNPQYVDAMKRMQEILSTTAPIKKQFGKTDQSMFNAIRNIDGVSKKQYKENLQKLDEILNTNYADEAEGFWHANYMYDALGKRAAPIQTTGIRAADIAKQTMQRPEVAPTLYRAGQLIEGFEPMVPATGARQVLRSGLQQQYGPQEAR